MSPPPPILRWCLLLGLAGLGPWLASLGEGGDPAGPLGGWSYDALFAIRSGTLMTNVVIVELDEKSFTTLGHRAGELWRRRDQARLLRKLAADGARLVVMDVFFAGAGEPAEDLDLAGAMQQFGKVAIAVDTQPLFRLDPGAGRVLAGAEPIQPAEPMRSAAAERGGVSYPTPFGGIARQHFHELALQPSLPWVAARMAGADRLQGIPRRSSRWLSYYGAPLESMPHLPFLEALEKPAGHFQGRYVFIGGGSRIKNPGELADTFRTPYTRWNHPGCAGVDLVAVEFLNLLQGDSLTRLGPFTEGLLLLVMAGGIAAACLLATLRQRLLLLLLLAAGIALLGLALPVWFHVWFAWLLPLVTLLPVGLAWACWPRPRRVEPVPLPTVLFAGPPGSPDPGSPATAGPGAGAGIPGAAMETAPAPSKSPAVADHTLLRRIGQGAYGEVWIARNAVGLLHAAKVIHRHSFESAAPFAREFRGITRFMPVVVADVVPRLSGRRKYKLNNKITR